MRAIASVGVFLALAAVIAVARATADEPTDPVPLAKTDNRTRIIPLVVVVPGETKTVLFSVECTVGVTRGGSLAVAEMVDGKPPFIGFPRDDDTRFRRAGVTVTVPDMDEAPKLDARMRSGALAALAKIRPVFPVTVTAGADADAEPVAIDLHLLDATCSGHCHTDFTVVVAAATEGEE